MSCHYIIEMIPDNSESTVKYASITQNSKWVSRCQPSRIEYLGEVEDDYDGLKKIILVTNIGGQYVKPKDFESELLYFLQYLEYAGEYDTPFLNFTRINTKQVHEYYKILEDEIDGEYFSLVEDLSDEDYDNIQKLYYDYHLESLLYSEIRKEYESHIFSNTAPLRELWNTRMDHMNYSGSFVKTTIFKFLMNHVLPVT